MTDVYKNKASGKHFICIEQLDNEIALLITPLGEIKTLNLNLFHEQELFDDDDFLASDLINKKQREQYLSSTDD